MLAGTALLDFLLLQGWGVSAFHGEATVCGARLRCSLGISGTTLITAWAWSLPKPLWLACLLAAIAARRILRYFAGASAGGRRLHWHADQDAIVAAVCLAAINIIFTHSTRLSRICIWENTNSGGYGQQRHKTLQS